MRVGTRVHQFCFVPSSSHTDNVFWGSCLLGVAHIKPDLSCCCSSLSPGWSLTTRSAHFHERVLSSAMFSPTELDSTISGLAVAAAQTWRSLTVWLGRKSLAQPDFFMAECYFLQIYTGNRKAAHLENLSWLKAWAARARAKAADSGSCSTQLISLQQK